MNYHSLKTLQAKSRIRVYLAAIIGGSLLVLPGCGIPGLRRAQSGPLMPQKYNWNNGATLEHPPVTKEQLIESSPYNQDADQDDQSDDLDDEEIDIEAKELDQSNSPVEHENFAGYLKAASYQILDKPTTSDKQANTTAVHVDAIDLEVDHEFDSDDLGMLGDRNDITDTNLAVSSEPMRVGSTSWENSAQLPQAAFFNDPYLLGLINQALIGNQELKILSEEIRIACNETYARSGEYRPFVTLGAGAGVEKPGRHTREGAVEDQLEVAPGREFPEPLPDFLVAANVSWELDIWKKLRNSRNAAAMRYLGTREGRTYIVTRLVAEVAENYYELLALDNRISTLDKTVEIQQQSLEIAEVKKRAGRGTELAVQRFQAEVRKNQSEKSIIAQEIVEVENRINFLLGRYPQTIERISVEYVDLNLHTLSAGVPSQLLQNRADIRQAEREVAAAGLDVKVARARFYPSLSLNAGLGWNAFSTGYLLKTPESLIYGVAGELVGPLINKRAIKADYCSANAAQLQSIYNYQQTVLEAHIEVVNQITKVENYRQSIEIKKQQLQSLEASVDAANKLFQNARAEYVEVLLAQRELMEAKMLLIETKQEQLAAIVGAYQALGGGGF